MARLFSGLIDSLYTKKWQPKGIPAIYKLIEGLSKRNIPTDVLLLCKTKGESKHIESIETIRFSNLNVQFYVVPYRENIRIKSVRINSIMNDIYQFIFCLSMIKRGKYSLIYSDPTNVVFAAFFSFFMQKKVVLRLLGVKPGQKSLTRFSKRIRHPILYLSYLADFSYIISSQDGSGVEHFLSHIRRKRVPYKILLNGVDDCRYQENDTRDFRSQYGFTENFPIILFVAGKMEKRKGCIQFVESLVELNNINQCFYAIMIGDGPLFDSIKADITKNKLEDRIKLLGAVRHDYLSRYYQLSDIYVSINFIGNLSNTVLEAIRAGKCLVILDKSIEEHIDESTEKIIPGDCAIRIDRKNIVKSLSSSLNMLLNNQDKIISISDNVEKLSSKIIMKWDERISYEIDLLEKVNKGEEALARFAQNWNTGMMG